MKLITESARDVPIVWFEVAIRGGSATDPVGVEGLTRHAAELARRGAGDRTRRQLDEALDQIGASVEVHTGRDAVTLHGVCLSRHLDDAIALAADVLAAPTMAESEHDKLLRESLAMLDEVRDDDGSLAQRYFVREIAPGHPYARTAVGTEASLAAIELDAARAHWTTHMVRDNLVVGFAGDVTEDDAARHAERLVRDIPGGPAPTPLSLAAPTLRPGRRIALVDKPERTQCQIYIGQPAPQFGSPDFDALTLVETVFGGTFTSRLMQEVRVKRGWSYGAGCRLAKGRGPMWLRIDFASAADVAPDALALVMGMLDDLSRDGITADELDFGHSYLSGSWPFSIATARDRLRVRTEAAACDVEERVALTWHERLAAVTLDDTRRAAATWLRPQDAPIVCVATAADMRDKLATLGLGPVEVIPHDAY